MSNTPRLLIAAGAALLLHLLAITWLLHRPRSEDQLPLAGEGVGLDAGAARENNESIAAAAPPSASDVAALASVLPQTKPESPAPPAPAGGGGGRDSYFARVRAHLNSYKVALPEGLSARGVAAVRFAVAADGTVSELALARSSGVAGLDEQALALVQRATPLPAPPQGRRLRLLVPIEFR